MRWVGLQEGSRDRDLGSVTGPQSTVLQIPAPTKGRVVSTGLGPGPGTINIRAFVAGSCAPRGAGASGAAWKASPAVEGGPCIGRVGGPILGTQHERGSR